MIKGCIFDLDGTLSDSLESIAHSANLAIGFYGFKENPIDDYKKYAGDGADELLKRSLIAAGDNNLEYFERVKEKYKEVFKENCMYNVIPYDGICEMLEKLKDNDIKIAVLSNKPHDRAVDVVCKLFGESYFDIVIGQSEKFKRKPSPEGALYIAEKLNIAPECFIYAGDTNTDMKTGKSAGMLTIGVTWGFRTKEELEKNNADYIIDYPLELLNFIKF